MDVEAGYILIVSAAKGGQKQRRVKVHPAFAPLLKEWHKADGGRGHVISWRGQPIKSFKTTWRKCLEDAEIIRRLRPYVFRHAFVTAALEAGADIGAVAGVVGSRPETLRKHYQHVTARLRDHAVDSVPAAPVLTIPKKGRYSQKKAKNDINTII